MNNKKAHKTETMINVLQGDYNFHFCDIASEPSEASEDLFILIGCFDFV